MLKIIATDTLFNAPILWQTLEDFSQLHEQPEEELTEAPPINEDTVVTVLTTISQLLQKLDKDTISAHDVQIIDRSLSILAGKPFAPTQLFRMGFEISKIQKVAHEKKGSIMKAAMIISQHYKRKCEGKAAVSEADLEPTPPKLPVTLIVKGKKISIDSKEDHRSGGSIMVFAKDMESTDNQATPEQLNSHALFEVHKQQVPRTFFRTVQLPEEEDSDTPETPKRELMHRRPLEHYNLFGTYTADGSTGRRSPHNPLSNMDNMTPGMVYYSLNGKTYQQFGPHYLSDQDPYGEFTMALLDQISPLVAAGIIPLKTAQTILSSDYLTKYLDSLNNPTPQQSHVKAILDRLFIDHPPPLYNEYLDAIAVDADGLMSANSITTLRRLFPGEQGAKQLKLFSSVKPLPPQAARYLRIIEQRQVQPHTEDGMQQIEQWLSSAPYENGVYLDALDLMTSQDADSTLKLLNTLARLNARITDNIPVSEIETLYTLIQEQREIFEQPGLSGLVRNIHSCEFVKVALQCPRDPNPLTILSASTLSADQEMSFEMAMRMGIFILKSIVGDVTKALKTLRPYTELLHKHRYAPGTIPTLKFNTLQTLLCDALTNCNPPRTLDTLQRHNLFNLHVNSLPLRARDTCQQSQHELTTLTEGGWDLLTRFSSKPEHTLKIMAKFLLYSLRTAKESTLPRILELKKTNPELYEGIFLGFFELHRYFLEEQTINWEDFIAILPDNFSTHSLAKEPTYPYNRWNNYKLWVQNLPPTQNERAKKAVLDKANRWGPLRKNDKRPLRTRLKEAFKMQHADG